MRVPHSLLFLVLAVSLALVACGAPPITVAPTQFVVDNHLAGADSINCNTVVKFKTLAFALTCAESAATPVKIVVQCSQPGVDYCDYQLPADRRFPKNRRGNPIMLIGEPELMPRILYEFVPDSPTKPIRVEDDWTIRGFTFDGGVTAQGGTTDDTNKTGALVNLNGNNIVFMRNEVRNTPYNCVYIGAPSTSGPSTHDITVSHNLIHDCKSADVDAKKDRFGTYTYDSDNILIAYNEFWNLSGDAFQNLNEFPPPKGNGRPGVASNTRIIGNKMWSACNYGHTLGAAYGENAIDIKRSGSGLVIRDNLIWGYRQSQDTTVPCHGTGSGDPGYAIVVHGQLEIEKEGTPLQPCKQVDAPCGMIEGNYISFTQAGIGVGNNGIPYPLVAIGCTQGVAVRGNYVADLQGIAWPGKKGKNRGLGLALATPSTHCSHLAFNDIYRNTLVNLHGNSFSAGADAQSFRVVNNLVALTAPEKTTQGAKECDALQPGGPQVVNNNWWYSALPPPPPDNRGGPVKFVAESGIVPQYCGAERGTVAAPHPENAPPPWDYRLAATALPPDVQDGGDAQFGERHTEMQGKCGNGPGIGADEFCPNIRRIYLAETSGAGDVFAEVFRGNDWGSSPDLGVRPDKALPFVVPTGSLLATMDLLDTVPITFTRGTSTFSEILLRVHSDGPLTTPEPVKVRIWGGVFGPNDPQGEGFPSGYELLVDATVELDGALQGTMANGGRWRKLAGTNDVRLFGFDWNVPGARHPRFANPVSNLERYLLRAEVAAANDPRPPLHTKVQRSNNLAQRPVFVVRQGVASDEYIIR